MQFVSHVLDNDEVFIDGLVCPYHILVSMTYRFTLKAPAAPPRKDRNLDGVIISETKDTAIAKHQVNSCFSNDDPCLRFCLVTHIALVM